MTTKTACIIGGAIILAMTLYLYFSPYERCVRAFLTKYNEVTAHNRCSALQFGQRD